MNWEAKLIIHKGHKRIAIYFAKDVALIERVKKLEGVRWSSTLVAWHVPDTDAYRKQFNIELRFVFNNSHVQKVESFEQWLLSKRYAASTVKTYTDALRSYLSFYNNKTIESMEANDLIVYNNEYILKNKLSTSYQNQIVNAIKLFSKA